MAVLVPMTTKVYVQYLHASVSGYAQRRAEAGRWPEKGELARHARGQVG